MVLCTRLESLFSAQLDLAKVFSDERCESLQKRVCVTHTPGVSHSFRIQVPCSATPASRSVLISLFAGPDPRTSCRLVRCCLVRPVCRRRIGSPLQARGFGGRAPEIKSLSESSWVQSFWGIVSIGRVLGSELLGLSFCWLRSC